MWPHPAWVMADVSCESGCMLVQIHNDKGQDASGNSILHDVGQFLRDRCRLCLRQGLHPLAAVPTLMMLSMQDQEEDQGVQSTSCGLTHAVGCGDSLVWPLTSCCALLCRT